MTPHPGFAGLLLVAVTAHGADATPPPPPSEPYSEAAGKIIGAALVSDRAYTTLAYLCDRFGHRLSGSPQLEAATDWAVERMRADGLTNPRKEKVMVPVWVRGEESARLLAPTAHRLNILGLGKSVGTPEGGIEAEVLVVTSFEELEARAAEAKGRIVLYDVPFTDYGTTVQFRSKGPSRAAKLGAVAVFVRSVGPLSYDTPHTGALSYEEGVPQIPAAAVTIENASMMHRMQDRGETIRAHLVMGARTLPDAPSANVIADLPGRELPEEIVLLAAHIDSWDVGQGAQDDGVGSIIAWEAARLIHALGLKPRRTIRVVLFTNEENGIAGGKGYRDAHRDELARHVAMIESDSGNGAARGFEFEVGPGKDVKEVSDEARSRQQALVASALVQLQGIAPLLAPLDATTMRAGGSGADVGPSVRLGVAGMGLDHDTTKYFEIHHTNADTFEKVDKNALNRNVATMAVMAYVLAEMPERLVPAAAFGSFEDAAKVKD